MVAKAFEEAPTAEEGELKSLNVNIDVALPPNVGSDDIGDYACEDAIEVEEENNGKESTN